MKVNRLFAVLVLEGALLVACDAATAPDDETNAPDATETDDAEDTDVEDADVEDTDVVDTDVVDTDTTAGTCTTDVCADTDSFVDCSSNGIACCWATDVCCDFCCGHL